MSSTGSINTTTTVPTGSVGVVGLGVMGHAIATRLSRELGALNITDLRRESATDLIAGGANFYDTAAATAAHSDIIVLSLNTAPIVEQVVFGPGGVLAGWAENNRAGLIIDMSSIAPDRTREFAARVAEQGSSWVDAPLSGGAPGALAGRLSLMVGGDDDAVALGKTALDHVATRVTHVGQSGAGQFVKLINQVLVGIGFSALAEVAVMTRAAGLEPAAVLSALTGGRADSALFQEFFVKFATVDFTPTGNVANMVKDLGTAAAAAQSSDLSLPLTDLVLAQNEDLVSQGYAQGDNANLMRLYQQV
ncbi:MAG: NAD(P)-dependent oxidoreductase [Nakamurella sp.]